MRTHQEIKTILVLLGLACLVVPIATVTATEGRGWITLFDGTTLDGWNISDRSHHGDTQDWSVEDGAIVGKQDKPGNGGVVLSEGVYGDFLLELELHPDWGLDSGLFLRSTPEGRCYQVMVDAYDGGSVGGIYGEGTGGFYQNNPAWTEHYKKDDWNRLLVLCVGNPPRIDVWLNGWHMTEWAPSEEDHPGLEPKLPAEGHIGLQVHAGDRYEGLHTRFRNIRIRPLGGNDEAGE
jgi:hypothetical protein